MNLLIQENGGLFFSGDGCPGIIRPTMTATVQDKTAVTTNAAIIPGHVRNDTGEGMGAAPCQDNWTVEKSPMAIPWCSRSPGKECHLGDHRRDRQPHPSTRNPAGDHARSQYPPSHQQGRDPDHPDFPEGEPGYHYHCETMVAMLMPAIQNPAASVGKGGMFRERAPLQRRLPR